MTSSPLDTAATDFIRAVHAGAFDRAAAALPTLSGQHGDALCRAVADLHAHRRHWDEAAAALAAVSTDDARRRVTLYRNLACLKSHRPAIYKIVVAGPDAPHDAYAPHALADGTLTVARTAGGRAVPLSTDPAAQVRAAAAQLDPLCRGGKAIAFLSVHDGHVLRTIAQRPPELPLGRQQAICVIEPDVSLLRAVLAVHDFTGPLGPIEQPRVGWYVGPGWFDAFRLDAVIDRYFVYPQTNVKQSPAGREIEARLLGVVGELATIDTAAAETVAKHYASLNAGDFAAVLSGVAGRPARVLLLTTRFSTVLQYSTRDADDAFRRLGCQTMTLIEPSPHHGTTRLTMRTALADFKPDLVFQIDHHRFEHGDLFPANLPFVNWIQDLLPHLMTPDAGRRLTPSDFVLTPSLQRWANDFAYPIRQCLEFRKLTRVPVRPPARKTDDRRVAYVSNWGTPPVAAREELLDGASGLTRDVTAAACDAMLSVYAAGRSLATPGDVLRVLQGVMADCGATADAAFVSQTASRLFDRFNNVLYRQQGLAWAAEACRQAGLTLDVYGRGWDALPPFAGFARGPIDYGPALETLARESAVTLILEPFMCTAHQRMLDALAAGGFCLVRDHPTHATTDAWIDLIAAARGEADTAASLRAALAGDDRDRFDATLAECERTDVSPGRIDPVATVRRLQDAGFLPAAGPMLPLLDRVAFDSPESLARKLARASADAGWRTDVSAAQRKAVENRYSYHTGMRRVLAFVAGRLGGEQAARRAA